MPRRWLFGLIGFIAVLLFVFVHHVLGQGPIVSVKVGANYSHYRGPCPAQLRFTANIYVDRYPMTYNYQWERSDGAKTRVQVVHVRNAAERHLIIHEDWTLGAQGEVWESLRVRTGNTDVSSEPARVIVECR